MRRRESRTCQFLPLPPEEVFPCFADAHNFQRITPVFPRFRVLTPAPVPMHEGARIDDRLRLHRLPVRWRTRIDAWSRPEIERIFRFRRRAPRPGPAPEASCSTRPPARDRNIC